MLLLRPFVVLARVALAGGAALLVVLRAVALAGFGTRRVHVQLVLAIGDVVLAAAAFPGEEAGGRAQGAVVGGEAGGEGAGEAADEGEVGHCVGVVVGLDDFGGE